MVYSHFRDSYGKLVRLYRELFIENIGKNLFSRGKRENMILF